MQLNKILAVNGVVRDLTAERVVLDLYAPGRAQFDFLPGEAEVLPNQVVFFDLGYSHMDTVQRYFVGFVETVVNVDLNRTKIFCREFSAALVSPLPLALRHASLRDVLTAVHEKTGVNFSVPSVNYADAKIAYFYNAGSGYGAMDNLARVFGIDDFIWQQQGAGVIYAGSWQDSRWAGLPDIELPADIFDRHSVQDSARLFAIPKIRPGMVVMGRRVTKVEFSGNHTVLSWKK